METVTTWPVDGILVPDQKPDCGCCVATLMFCTTDLDGKVSWFHQDMEKTQVQQLIDKLQKHL